MRENYKKIGNYIQRVTIKNTNGSLSLLQGIKIDKYFMPSVANVVGTDLTKYKIVKPNQFSCNRMHVGRDKRLPIAHSIVNYDFIVSPAYDVFEIIDISELNPEYLMMWFSRSEFDRNCWFYTDTDVRGKLGWDSLCDIELPIPSIEKQNEIVKEYNTIVHRIKLNEQLNKKLEETAQAIYKHWFVEQIDDRVQDEKLGDLCSLITDGKHGNCIDEENSGYYFLSAKDVRESTLIYNGARQITKNDFEETHRRTNLMPKDICLVNTGATIGRMSLAPNSKRTQKTTFQKSVAILKPKNKVTEGYYLFCLLRNRIPEIKELGKGTSQPNLLLGDLREFIIKYPGYDKVIKFEKVISPFFETHYSKTFQNIKLNELKDLLLSKMSKVEL